jgi:hypothetical protein
MGLISKIEDKLSGNKHHDEKTSQYSTDGRTSLNEQSSHPNTDSTSYTGHGASHHAGSSQPHSSSGHDSRAANDLRHPVQSTTGHSNDGYGAETGGYKTRATEPVDPTSTKGQNAMANATSGGQMPRSYDYGDSNTYAGDQSVDRSRHGGITNSGNGSGFRSGHHSSLEDPSAIPTAGGRKVGDVGSEIDQHHYGRDAAVTGGAGALGAGAYDQHERGSHGLSSHVPGSRHHEGQSSTHGQDPYQSSGLSSAQQYGGVGSGRDPHDQHTSTSGHHAGGLTGGVPVPTEKKVGGAYEAGYRDAMAHLEADRQR